MTDTYASKLIARIVENYRKSPAAIAKAFDEVIDRSGNSLGWIRELVREDVRPPAEPDTDASKLDECPFCGATCIEQSDGTLVDRSEGRYFVECGWCHAQGPLEDTETEAITAWNTRRLVREDVRPPAEPGSTLPDHVTEAIAAKHGLHPSTVAAVIVSYRVYRDSDTPAEPASEPTRLNDVCPHCRGFGFVTVAGASDLARAANPKQVYPYRVACGNCQGTGRKERPPAEPDQQTDEALNRAMLSSHTIVGFIDHAELDQDTLDLRSLFAGYDTADGPRFMAGAYDDGPSFERAKAVLAAIKDRVRREEREAVCKGLREWEAKAYDLETLDADTVDWAASYIERGEHRDTRP